MAGKLQIRRGTIGGMPALLEGELGFAYDSGELYIGSLDGTNNKLIGPENQRWIDSSTQRQDLRDAADGYSDLSAVSGDILPITDLTYNLGSTSLRWKDGYFGPTSLHIYATAGETDGTARDYNLNIDSTGNFIISEAENDLLTLTPAGNVNIAGNITSLNLTNLDDQTTYIQNSLDGYATVATEDQRWVDSSTQRQDLRDATDGYITDSNLTNLEDQTTDIQLSLDGYALTTTENQRWIDSSQQRQDLRDAADGYVETDGGLANTLPVWETDKKITYSSQLGWDEGSGILTVGDGTLGNNIYLNGAAETRRRLAIFTGGVNRWRIGTSDIIPETGSDVGSNFSIARFDDAGDFLGVPLAIRRRTGDITIASTLDVDGYVSAETLISDVAIGTAPLTVTSTTLVSNLNVESLNSQVGSYYLDSGNFTGTDWTDLTDAGATTLHKHDHGGLDGLSDNDHPQYSLVATENQRWVDSSTQRQDLRDAADGYIADFELTVLENQTTDIQNSLDGYALTATEDQRWVDSSSQRQDLRDAADGYITNSSLTVLENQTTDIQNSLDGYALTTTENQRWVDSSTQRQDLRDATDGYATLIGADFTDAIRIFDSADGDESKVLVLDHDGTDGYVYTKTGAIRLAANSGKILLTNSSGADFSRLQFGGTTSSYPSLRRAGTNILARLADDSGYCAITAGSFYGTQNVQAGEAYPFLWSGRSRMYSPAEGSITLQNIARTDFDLLQFGGTTIDFPALKRVGKDIHIRDAADGDYTSLACMTLDAYGAANVRGPANVANTLYVDDINSRVGINVSAPDYLLEAYGGDGKIVFGNHSIPLQIRVSRLGLIHYDTSENDICSLATLCTDSVSGLGVGGGTATMNAFMQVDFYTAPDLTTTTGLKRMGIDSVGDVTVYNDLYVSGRIHNSILGEILDGYVDSGDLSTYALAATEDQRWIDSSTQRQDLRDATDGYLATDGTKAMDGFAPIYWGSVGSGDHPKIVGDDNSIIHITSGDDGAGHLDVSGNITGAVLISDVAIGTAPLTITSTTLVSNLNVESLNSQVGSYYLDSGNFTGTNWTDLTDSNATTLHKHDHGNLDGLNDNDHPQYSLVTTENQRWSDSSTQRQDLRNAADGYVTDSNLTVLENQTTDIQNSLDGYASVATENQRWVDSSTQRQDLRDAADGYIETDGGSAETLAVWETDKKITYSSQLGWNEGTGILTVGDGTLGSNIYLNGAAETRRRLAIFTNGVNRWRIGTSDIIPETGSDVGSNFSIARFDDAGDFLGTPLVIRRRTGDITIASTLDVDGYISAETLISDVAIGTAPLTVTSTTLVSNLNVESLNSQVGSYYLDSDNFTGTDWDDLTDSGATTLHKHDHGNLDGLSDNDHPQYSLVATEDQRWIDSSTQRLDLRDAADGYLPIDGTKFMTGSLKLGGSTIGFPALKRVGKDLHLREAADGDYTSLACMTLDAYGPVNVHGSSSDVTLDADIIVNGGGITANGAGGGAGVQINGNAETYRGLTYQTGGINRWTFTAGNEAESGGDVGTILGLSRWTDAGAWSGTVLSFSRVTGQATFGYDVNIAGSLYVDGSDIYINGAAETRRRMSILTSGVNRWKIGTSDIIPETGSDVGSNFSIARFDDAGDFLGVPVAIRRRTGDITIGSTLYISDGYLSIDTTDDTSTPLDVSLNGTSVFNITTPYAGLASVAKLGDGVGHAWLSINGGAETFRTIDMLTAGTARWSIGTDDVAESGSDAGSNFMFARYSDAEALLGRSLSIERSSGNVTIGAGDIYGKTTSGDGLDIFSTSHATKGTINLGDTAYVDEANNRVGIGESSPSTRLQIKHGTSTDGIWLESNSVDENRFVMHNDLQTTGKRNMALTQNRYINGLMIDGNDNDGVYIRNIVTILHDGYVGIGTYAPDTVLHVHDDDSFIQIDSTDRGVGNLSGIKMSTYTTSLKTMIANIQTEVGYEKGELAFCVDDADDHNGVSISDEVMRITAGRVGINETSPDALLHTTHGDPVIHQKIERTGASASNMTLTNASSLMTWDYSATGFTWELSNTEQMRLINGKLGIGTTPSVALHVKSVAAANVYGLIESTGDYEASLRLKNTQGEWEIKADNGADVFRISNYGTASLFTLTTAGWVGLGSATTPTAALDVSGDSVRIRTSQSPASSSTGVQGEWAWDASYFYICTSTNVWKRVTLTGGY